MDPQISAYHHPLCDQKSFEQVVGLRWLMGLVQSGRTQRCLDSVLKAAAVASGDKAVEVREAATHLAAALVKVGHSFILDPTELSTGSGSCPTTLVLCKRRPLLM